MKTKIIAFSLMAASNISVGADISIIAGGFSYHFNKSSREMLNQEHAAVGVKYNELSVVYINDNSYGGESIYAAYEPVVYSNDYLELHGIIGAATGYNEFEYMEDGSYFKNKLITVLGEDLQPLAGIGLELSVSHYGISVDVTPSVVMFSSTYKF